MPEGKPDFPSIRNYKTISQLIAEEGKNKMLKAVMMLVRDFASGINVVRNINEDQAIEIAFMLINECGNFRLEDYAMMFDMAKKGQIGNIFDHLDIQVVSKILDQYWSVRQNVGRQEQEKEYSQLEGMGPSMRAIDDIHPDDARLQGSADGLAGAMGSLKQAFSTWKDESPIPNHPNYPTPDEDQPK